MSTTIDRFTHLAMDQVSRRGFLKGIGALGLSVVAATMGGLSKLQIAAANCPGECFGPCTNCSSQCSSGGMTCLCSCSSCNCTPRKVYAYGSWYGSPCVFDCACVACG